jgi:hypothetical protein
MFDPKPIRSPSDPRITRWFRLDKYKGLSSTSYWEWAFQIAIRQSCCSNAIDALDKRFGKRVRKWTRLDDAIRMLTNTPVVTWDVLRKYDLDDSDFIFLTRLLDDTLTPYPSINTRLTIGAAAELVRRARWLAKKEPWRCDVKDEDQYGRYDPEDLPINNFLNPDEHLVYVMGRPTDQDTRRQVEYLLQDFPNNRERSHIPNALSITKLRNFRVLECMDLYIFALNLGVKPLSPSEFKLQAKAGMLFGNIAETWRITRTTDPLVMDLFAADSRHARELVALAAQERAEATRRPVQHPASSR